MRTWWYSLAKEEKSDPRKRTRPPTTAHNRDDFRLQKLVTSGETRDETVIGADQSRRISAGDGRKSQVAGLVRIPAPRTSP